jgi:hypothetical protein
MVLDAMRSKEKKRKEKNLVINLWKKEVIIRKLIFRRLMMTKSKTHQESQLKRWWTLRIHCMDLT